VGGFTQAWKRSAKLHPLRVLDPACGSGSFLLGAYQHLLDWYRERYIEDGPQRHARGRSPRLFRGPGGEWRLTTAERKRILLAHIYGVDIDPQAVEVTKLSLLLKVLEGETEETLDSFLRLFQERALPDLGANIKCGNSLIGPDFWEGKEYTLLDEEERYRINPFDWPAEFPDVFSGDSPGFDAVIGNPPYVFTRGMLSDEERSYFSRRYETSWEKHNTYMLFMELMVRVLDSEGLGSFIVPNSWMTIESAKILRALLVPRLRLIADLNYTVFHRVSMEPCIFVVSGTEATSAVIAVRAGDKAEFERPRLMRVTRSSSSDSQRRITLSQSAPIEAVIEKIVACSQTIQDVFDVRTGLQAYEQGKGSPPQSAVDVREHVFDRDHREDEHSVRYLRGRDVGRYRLNWAGMWMQYGPWLAQPREMGIFSRPRVLLREITSEAPRCLNATYATETFLNNKSVLNILHDNDAAGDLMLLLAALNSRVLSLFYKQKAVKSSRKVFPKVVIRNLREFPFPQGVSSSTKEGAGILVQRILNLHKQLATAKTAHEKTALQRQITATDNQIDQLVYDLYGLTADEIKIVEEATRHT